MHSAITKAFNKYHLFGFTGTPIFAKNSSSGGRPDLKTTEQAFGEKLHTFDVRLVPNVIDGVVAGVTAVSRDISALYDLKHDLEQTKQEISAVLESSSDAIWSVDAQLRIRTLNARFVEETFDAVGVSPRVGMNIRDILGDRFFRVAPFYERALAGESFGFEFSYPLPRKGGPPEVRHLEVQMLPLRNAVDQSVIGVTVFNNGGAALTHYANTRWSQGGWIGTDASVRSDGDAGGSTRE